MGMVRRSLFIGMIFTALIAFTTVAWGQEEEEEGMKPRIAVLDFVPSSVPKGIAASVTDMLSTELVNSKLFEVVERMQVAKILDELGFQKTGITDSGTAAELGKLLNIKKVVIGNVGKLGQDLVVTMKIVDVQKADILVAEKEVAKGEDDLVRACEVLAKKVVKGISGVDSKGLKSGSGDGISTMAIAGWSTLGAGALFVVLGGVGHWQMDESNKEWEKSGASSAKSDYDTWKSVAISGYVIGGAGLLTGATLLILDAVLPKDDGSPRAAVMPMPGGAYVALEWRW